MLHNILLKILIACVLIGAGLFVAEIWGFSIGEDLLWKILGTLLVVTVASGLIMVAKNDLGNKKDLKDNNYLD